MVPPFPPVVHLDLRGQAADSLQLPGHIPILGVGPRCRGRGGRGRLRRIADVYGRERGKGQQDRGPRFPWGDRRRVCEIGAVLELHRQLRAPDSRRPVGAEPALSQAGPQHGAVQAVDVSQEYHRSYARESQRRAVPSQPSGRLPLP